ncbi:MAG: DUF4270 family protein [Alistipes sp.]|nr:DUF4270 family protein [Candidatus Minthomonas equi]
MSSKSALFAAGFLAVMTVASCVINDKTLGQQFVSDDYLVSIDSTSFLMPFRQSVHDTIQAISYSNMMVGCMTDNVYGTTAVDAATLVVPIPDTCYLGINPKLLNVYLDLTVDSTLVYKEGDDAIPQNIYVYEIVKDFASDSSKVYNNSLSAEFLSEKPISYGASMLFGKGKVRIELSGEYGEKLLATSPSEFENVSSFLDRIHGLYFKTDRPAGNQDGGRLNIMGLSTSVINVQFLMTDPAQGLVDKDTTISFLCGYGIALNQFSAGSRHLETATPGEKLYMDGLSGVKPVIPGLDLKDILDRWISSVCETAECERESILISQARLILPYSMPENFELFEKEHPLKIYPFTTNVGAADSTVRMKPLDDITHSSGGGMDRSHQYYYCDISSKIQELITKDRGDVTDEDDLWMCPVSVLENEQTGIMTYDIDVNGYPRVILEGPQSLRPPRLELVYGILKQW